MDRLPSELLVDIFSFVDISHLFELRQVCTHWQLIIDDYPCFWRRKRRITKRDLGPYTSLETQVNRLIYLLEKLDTIEYYFFPVLLDDPSSYTQKSWWLRHSLTKGLEESLRRLYGVLQHLFRAGRIPVHLTALDFMVNMVGQAGYRKKNPIELSSWTHSLFEPSRLEPHCPFSKCTSIIMPEWPPDYRHRHSSPQWLKYLTGKMASNLKEMVIENLLSRSVPTYHYELLDHLRVETTSGVYAPATIRVLKMTGNDSSYADWFIDSVRLRWEREMFTFDEFVRFINLYREHDRMLFMTFLNQLQAEGRILHSQMQCFGSGTNIDQLLDSVEYGECMHARINCFTASVSCKYPASLTLRFLRDDPYRGVTKLTIHLNNSDCACRDDYPVHAWRCLLQEDILTRLTYLCVEFRIFLSNEDSQVLAAPALTFALPRLDSLEFANVGSVSWVCSLLNAAPNLRRLRLSMRCLNGTRTKEEHLAFRSELLAAISQLTRLVSLSIELQKPKDSQNKWLRSWTTYAGTKLRQTHASIHLKEEVFDALSKLVRLDRLAISFSEDHKNDGRLKTVPMQQDMCRLASTLPRLRVVFVCCYRIKKRMRECVGSSLRALFCN